MKTKKRLNIAFVGIGGYGEAYLKELFSNADDITSYKHGKGAIFSFTNKMLEIFIEGVADPYADKSSHKEQLINLNIPIYNSIEELYEKRCEPDLVVLSTPIHLHTSQILFALDNGSNVLCEKPLCATTEEVYRLHKALSKKDKFAAVGFQWSFSHAMLNLKKDLHSGLFGAPVRLKTLCFWPRNSLYYERNSWAGKIKINNNIFVYDSPLSNATAHYLHNMLFILGETNNSAAYPTDITAELYKVKPIENFDTAALRLHTESNTEILFSTTHSVYNSLGPLIEYQFEDAIAFYPHENQDSSWTANINTRICNFKRSTLSMPSSSQCDCRHFLYGQSCTNP